MKRGVWLAIVVGCFGLVAVPVKAISPDLCQNDLARAQTFYVGPWEVDIPPFYFGPNANQRELRLLLKQPDAATRMRWLLSHGTAEGRMWGLYGLRLLHDPEFEAYASRLEEQPGEILTTTVVPGFHKTKSEVIERIRRNDFHF
jgi:hypothetical protein